MPADDLNILAAALRDSARQEPNGEVAWPLADAPAVISAIADAGRLILGLDLRTYDDEGGVSEVAWSVYRGSSVEDARREALASLLREELPGDWVLVTW